MNHRPYIWIDEADADAHVRFFRSRQVLEPHSERLIQANKNIRAYLASIDTGSPKKQRNITEIITMDLPWD